MIRGTKTRQWILVSEGIIIDTHRSNTDQPGMVEVPWNADVKKGTPINYYNKKWLRMPDHVLVKKGIRRDRRGRYWSKKDCKSTIKIDALDHDPPEGFTPIPPIPGKPCVWKNGGWVADVSEK